MYLKFEARRMSFELSGAHLVELSNCLSFVEANFSARRLRRQRRQSTSTPKYSTEIVRHPHETARMLHKSDRQKHLLTSLVIPDKNLSAKDKETTTSMKTTATRAHKKLCKIKINSSSFGPSTHRLDPPSSALRNLCRRNRIRMGTEWNA